MKYRLSQIKTDIEFPMENLPEVAAKMLHIDRGEILEWEIRRKSIDSRKKPDVKYVYTIDFTCRKKLKPGRNKNLIIPEDDVSEMTPEIDGSSLNGRIVVVGTGPAGLFAALELAKAGLRPLVIERGSMMSKRVSAVDRFKKERLLDPETNMLFGEGGAGTFSDGKLATGIKDGLIRQVLTEFKEAGAQEEIMYMAKPHIGTDVLRKVIVNLRKKIESMGGEFFFDTKLESFLVEDGRLSAVKVKNENKEYDIDCEALVLAIGHSARDTFKMVKETGLDMQQKAFSIGVRMEHPQSLIDEAQYGVENVGKLPPADYKINYKASNGRGVYSFCMCPGGEVVVCSTAEDELCVNGMSNSKRDSGTANSGILCDVRTEDFGSDDVLAGVRFQEKYERLAFENGGGDYNPPKCSMEDFLNEKGAAVINSLPRFASDAIIEAVPEFGRKIKGYDNPEAVITAVETRSSSPVRILRDEHGESNIKGIYPAGEGAGYAGGITSAACDGIRAARNIISRL